jgi:hypothetical protein
MFMKKKKKVSLFILSIFVMSVFLSGCAKGELTQLGGIKNEGKPSVKLADIDLTKVKSREYDFTGYYSHDPVETDPNVEQYNLPLNKDEIENYEDFTSKLKLSKKAISLLEKNGFAVFDSDVFRKEDNITKPYSYLQDNDIPIFITSDSLLHLYHIQFDETLRKIEEDKFYEMIWLMSSDLLLDALSVYGTTSGDLKEAAKRNLTYFSVALSLLQPQKNQLCPKNVVQCTDPGIASAYFKDEDLQKYNFEIPVFVKEQVKKELALIQKHEKVAVSPLFKYKEDYTQYVPRGHYTRSEKLKNYFKAMMWYGRLAMLLKGNDDTAANALISEYDAKIQTIQATLISARLADSKETRDYWNTIYSITAFYVGLADDLGPYEYIEAMREVFGDTFSYDEVDSKKIKELKIKLAEYSSPKIYGGTGACELKPPFSLEQANECLEVTKGFRLMGQRFIPDSYMFSNLVGSYTGPFMGKSDECENVFTCIISAAGRLIRGFPRGLDVMALLNSVRAQILLNNYDDNKYKDYDNSFEQLAKYFASFTKKEWNKNLYFSWLYSLKALLTDFGNGYPTFMQTKAWKDKELTTALASWTELRHDTILYAKQSYTMVETAIPSPPKPVVGYIEPVPEFYNRLLSLTKMTTSGLDQMGVLDPVSKNRLLSLERVLKRLVDISIKELNNEELTKDDYEFIENFSDQLEDVIADVKEESQKTTIIADVHTDYNTGMVLEEGVGNVKMMAVAYKLPDKRILIGAGPVFTYYEFKHPMDDRLTNEKWREKLRENPPPVLDWVKNFSE